MSILRLAGVTREIGTFDDPRFDRCGDRARRPDRTGRPEWSGQDDAAPPRGGWRRTRPRHGEPQAQPVDRPAGPGGAPRRDVHGVAGPPVGGPLRCGPPRGDGRGARHARAGQPGDGAGLRRSPAPLRGPRRLHPGPARRCRVERSWVHARRMGQAAGGVVGRGTDAGGARAARHRRPGSAAPRRADEPPRPRRARMAGGTPAAPDRLTARRLARPRLPGRDRHPDLGAPRSPAHRVPWRLQRIPTPARRARCAGDQGGRHPGRADRPRTRARPALSEPPQVQQDARARGTARAVAGGAPRGATQRSEADPAAGFPGRLGPVTVW